MEGSVVGSLVALIMASVVTANKELKIKEESMMQLRSGSSEIQSTAFSLWLWRPGVETILGGCGHAAILGFVVCSRSKQRPRRACFGELHTEEAGELLVLGARMRCRVPQGPDRRHEPGLGDTSTPDQTGATRRGQRSGQRSTMGRAHACCC